MNPRSQNFPAGSIGFYFNNTSSQWWPETVTADTELSFCNSSNATQYPTCPSGGFSSLSRTLGAFEHGNLCKTTGQSERYAPFCQALGLWEARAWDNFLVQGPWNLIPAIVNGLIGPAWNTNCTTAIQPHVATVVLTQYLVNTWAAAIQLIGGRNKGQFKWAYDFNALATTKSPFVRAKCSLPQNLSANADSAAFPFLARAPKIQISGQSWEDMNGFTSISRNASIAGLNRTRPTQIRTQWLPLPMDTFGDTVTNSNTTILLLELPWLNDSRAALGCAIAAAWHDTTLSSLRSATYGAWRIIPLVNAFGSNGDSPSADKTNQPVTLDPSWLELLTPTTPSLGSSPEPLNTLENILDSTGVTHITRDLRMEQLLVPYKVSVLCPYHNY